MTAHFAFITAQIGYLGTLKLGMGKVVSFDCTAFNMLDL